MDFLDELQHGVVPADGAMGTELMEAGVPVERCFEELCVSQPELVRGVHESYLAAGARLIETNSFGANAVRLAKHGFERRVSELNWSAAQLAKDAAKGQGVYVAGSVGPLGISAEQAAERGIDRHAVFTEQIGALLDGGCNVILLETFLDLEELLIALRAKQALHHCPVVTSLSCNDEGRLGDGTLLLEAFARLRAADADVVGVNCVNGPSAMVRLFENITEPGPLSAFPNAGYPKFHEGRFLYFTTPDYFAKSALELARQGARLIGGCCGTGPRHVAAMAEMLKDFRISDTRVRVETPAPRVVTQVPKPAICDQQSAGSAPTLLDLLAQKKTVILTELDPPKTLDLEKFYAGAEALTKAGSDLITLADNSLAILRVSNLAIGAVLQQRGIAPLLHLSCRDRNVIGLQSELMGMAALGIRHVLPLTGDPSKVGDHPGATSVYDVTSIELMKIITQLNAGLNANGRAIKQGTQLVIGCTFNPNAKNLDAQLSRLERKIVAGAQYVMTQPVFHTRLVEELARRTKPFGIPIFTGVWPLLNGRQAEFLHNEVPGISIPDAVRSAMHGQEGAGGRKKGVELAKEVCRAVLDHFPGVYLITPFLNYETTVELAHFARGRAS